MKMMHLAFVVLALAIGPAYADEDSTPVVIKTPTTTYIINTKSERMRQALLNADRITIKNQNGWKDRNYYKHHKYIRDHENMDTDTDRRRAAEKAGYAAGYKLSD